MLKLNKIFGISIIVIGISTTSCEKQVEDVTPVINVKPPITEFKPQEIDSKSRVNSNYQKQIINAFKRSTGEEMKYQSGWAPSPPLDKPAKWKVTLTSEKAREISSTVSASLCSKSEMETLILQACVEASASVKQSLSQATTVERTESLKAKEQCRYKVLVVYDYFQGTLVLTPPNGYGAGSIAPMSYTVYYKVPRRTYATTEKRLAK
ncbi:MAG: hypothetical protein MUF45_11505 [Spirosomaceae bacterium]|jgi:hypothetical protein|nr:hypothetical protein [Spirosomataceae bacterium]